MLKITLPGIPPSNNKYLGNSKSHHLYRAEKAEWTDTIGWVIKAAGWRGKPLKKAQVQLIYHFPDRRRRDPDNYSGKFILDGLKEFGVIVDDSFSNVQLVLTAGKVDRDNPNVEILVSSIA